MLSVKRVFSNEVLMPNARADSCIRLEYSQVGSNSGCDGIREIEYVKSSLGWSPLTTLPSIVEVLPGSSISYNKLAWCTC